jgi:hypothetical protein
MRRLVASLLALLCLTGHVFAQATPAVQQTGIRFDAASNVGFAQAAVNNASVLTITPPGGMYVYLTAISIDACQDATGVASTNANVTSSGIIGTPSWSFSSALAVNTCNFSVGGAGPVGYGYPATTVAERFTLPLRSSVPGTAVVLTSPSSTHTQFTIRAYYYFAP